MHTLIVVLQKPREISNPCTWLLEEDKTYVGIMQSYADKEIGKDKVQFLNAGAGGWGLADFYDYLIEFGDSVHPEMVLVYFNADDIGRSLNRQKFFNAHSKGAELKKKFNDSKVYQWFLEHSHLVQWIRNRLVNMSQKTQSDATQEIGSNKSGLILPSSSTNSNEANKGVVLAKTIFEKIHDWCKVRNIQLVVTTTGWHFDIETNSQDPEVKFLEEANRYFLQMDSVLFKDITPEVLASMKGKDQKEFIIEGDYHPNEKGAELIANHSWIFLHPLLAGCLKFGAIDK